MDDDEGAQWVRWSRWHPHGGRARCLQPCAARAQDGRAALAGAPPQATGVYVGCVWQEYALALERARVAPSVAVLTGSGLNFMVGRVSYTFGLQGAHPARPHRLPQAPGAL